MRTLLYLFFLSIVIFFAACSQPTSNDSEYEKCDLNGIWTGTLIRCDAENEIHKEEMEMVLTHDLETDKLEAEFNGGFFSKYTLSGEYDCKSNDFSIEIWSRETVFFKSKVYFFLNPNDSCTSLLGHCRKIEVERYPSSVTKVYSIILNRIE